MLSEAVYGADIFLDAILSGIYPNPFFTLEKNTLKIKKRDRLQI